MRLLATLAGFALTLAIAVPGTVLASHAGPLTATCTNPEVGYTVNFPNNWYYNEHVSGAGGEVEQCRYFSPDEFAITPGSEPTDVSVGINPQMREFDPSGGEAVTVGGRDAYRSESESTQPGFEGTYYTYVIARGGGEVLVASTSDRWIGDYDENKQILDAMMQSMTFAADETAMPAPDATQEPQETLLPDAAVPATGTGPGAIVAVLGVLFAASGVVMVARRR